MSSLEDPPASPVPTAVALTIAGSDPSGGAGLQADLKTFHQHQVYGMSVVTLLTVQNTQTVDQVWVLDADFVEAQLDAVLTDIPPLAAKTGALGNAEVVQSIAQRARDFPFPLVIDPVMISKHGANLLGSEAAAALVEHLLPLAYLVTPNLREAAALSQRQVDDLRGMEIAARAIADLGAANVLVKGGHLAGEAIDVLWADQSFHRLADDRIDTPHTHGTGCVYSAAITAGLARQQGLVTAVTRAKAFVTEAIRTNPHLGKDLGPTNMFAPAFSGERGLQ